jgi:uncharacterized protein YjbI with pentapeptide repeats
MDQQPSQPFFDLHQKTLWDWLSLLIVPILLAGGGWWISHQSEQAQQRIADERYQQELFRGYLDQISTLLVENDLQSADEFSEVKTLAQSITATTLRELDSQRRNSLMLFLRSTGLATPLPGSNGTAGILSWASLENMDLSDTTMNAIDLNFARLTNSDLTNAYLGGGSNLTNVKFINTTLKNTQFDDADLRDAVFAYTNLEDTNLTEAQLTQAKLCNVRMPDGSESDRDCNALIEQKLCNVEPPSGVNPSTFQYPDCEQVMSDYLASGGDYSPDHRWDMMRNGNF